MGVHLLKVSSSSFDLPPSVANPNPDPANYKVISATQTGSYLLLRVKYPNCNTFEGDKILVYKATLIELMNQKLLDPHFSDNPHFFSPIARFKPTPLGMIMAQEFVKLVSQRWP